MSDVSAQTVKQLREQTGAGMMDCKKALQEVGGDIEKAVDVLRKKGLKSAAKRAGKVAAEGVIGNYVHTGGKISVLVEVNCETDFVARGDDFQGLAKKLAMHIAWAKPTYVSREEVPESAIAREKEVLSAQLKPEQQKMADKILQGKLGKFYEEHCLLEQVDALEEGAKKKFAEVITELSAKIGEKISVRRFVRLEVGEGIEKQESNFAEEVAAAVQGV